MKFETHVYVHNKSADAILALLTTLIKKVEFIMSKFDDITREVEENTTVVASAVALFGSLSQEIRANAADPAALADLASRLDANSNALADAIAANTVAEGEEPQ